jgi:hypothetical protein
VTDELERRLQASFQRAALPQAPERLRDYLAHVPAMERRHAPAPRYSLLLQAAAIVAVAAVSVGLLAFAMALQGLPATEPSPSPTASQPVAVETASVTPTAVATLPPTQSPRATSSADPAGTSLPGTPADLLADRPDATIRVERSFGPADRPVSDDATMEQVDVGGAELRGSAVLSAACLGPGELELQIRFPEIPSAGTFVGLVTPCDGNPTTIDYPAEAADPNRPMRLMSVTVARGAAWRLAAAEVPTETSEAPQFAPIQGTRGWWELAEAPPAQAGPEQGSGVEMKVPQPVSELGITVQCAGEATVAVVFEHLEPDLDDITESIMCPTDDAGLRFLMSVSGGDHVKLQATPDTPVWIRLHVEGNEKPVATYPAAPPLPDGIGDLPYAVGNTRYLAMSTFGSSRQELIRAPGAYPWPVPGGDYVAVGANTPENTTLYLASIPDGGELRPLVELPADRYIGATWVDAVHEQVFFLVARRSGGGLEIQRVALDGSGQQVVIAVPDDAPMAAFDMAHDNSVFLLDACVAGDCSRVILDAETLQPRTVPVDVDGEICDVLGVVDEVAVIQTSSSCQQVGPERAMVTSLDGTDARPLDGVVTGTVMRTADGPHIAYMVTMSDPVEIMDLATGESRTLEVESEGRRLEPHLRLPPDWLLLTPWHGVNDFPSDQLFKSGQPPVLVNVLTGETIEMVNLPH